jgi:hypothetical protein
MTPFDTNFSTLITTSHTFPTNSPSSVSCVCVCVCV